MQANSSAVAREAILKKIRAGLSKAQMPMPYPEAEGKALSTVFTYRGISAEETFAEEFIKLGGKFLFCDNEQEMMRKLVALFDSKNWPQLLCSDPRLLALFKENRLDFITPAAPENESADACITGCDAMVARTGSVILSSSLALGRMAPVFYPIHIIIAYADQLVEDITPALDAVLKQSSIPSMINLNTGPSRTADIEKTLVVGVHGPGEVYCFFINR